MRCRVQECVPFYNAMRRWRSFGGVGLRDEGSDWSSRKIEPAGLEEKTKCNEGRERRSSGDEEEGGEGKGREEEVESKGNGMASKDVAGCIDEADGGDKEVFDVGIGETTCGEDVEVKYLVSSWNVT